MNSEKALEGGGDSDIVFASIYVRRHFWVVSRAEKHSVFEFKLWKNILIG